MNKQKEEVVLNNIDILDFCESYYDIDFKDMGEWKMSSCPFPGHLDGNPSFGVCSEKKIYNCFVCRGGNVINFVQKMEGLNYSAAIEFLYNLICGETDDRIISLSNRNLIQMLDKYLENENTYPGGLAIASYFNLLNEKIKILFPLDKQEELFKAIDEVFIEGDINEIDKVRRKYGF